MAAIQPRPCLASEGNPPATISRYCVIDGLKFLKRILIPPRIPVILSMIKKLTASEMAVARPAPATPISNAKIKIGSRMTLRTAPIEIPIIDMNALPWSLIWLFRTKVPTMNGVPRRM